MTAKTAFARVAEQLHSHLGEEFAIDGLELYRPVPLTTPALEERTTEDIGVFQWFTA